MSDFELYRRAHCQIWDQVRDQTTPAWSGLVAHTHEKVANKLYVRTVNGIFGPVRTHIDIQIQQPLHAHLLGSL